MNEKNKQFHRKTKTQKAGNFSLLLLVRDNQLTAFE